MVGGLISKAYYLEHSRTAVQVHLLRSLEDDACKGGEKGSAVPAVRKVPSLLFDIEVSTKGPHVVLTPVVGWS